MTSLDDDRDEQTFSDAAAAQMERLVQDLGLVPDRDSAVRDGRVALAEGVAAGMTAILSSGDTRRLDAVLDFVRRRNDDLQSVGLRNAQGRLVVTSGEHARRWVPAQAGEGARDLARGHAGSHQILRGAQHDQVLEDELEAAAAPAPG